MKCEDCLNEILVTLKKQVGEDKDVLWTKLYQRMDGISEAITSPYKAHPMCLKHYLDWKA